MSEEKLAKLLEENKTLKRMNEILMEGQPSGLNVHQAEKLLHKEKAQVAKLKAALEGLIGVTTKKELQEIEIAMRTTTAPERDKTVMLNAVHALLEIIEESER